MKKVFTVSILTMIIGLSVYLIGCATITTGTTQSITINCNVKDAIIKLDGVTIGKTPFIGEISKNGNFLSIEKEGYETHRIALSTSLEGMFWGNIIIGGTLGSITDFASGAAFKYSPASFQVELIAEDVSESQFEQYYELRKFSMINMSNIAVDISNNSGHYLESLIYLAKLDNNQTSKELIKQKFTQSNGDQVKFGNLMVELLDKQLL